MAVGSIRCGRRSAASTRRRNRRARRGRAPRRGSAAAAPPSPGPAVRWIPWLTALSLRAAGVGVKAAARHRRCNLAAWAVADRRRLDRRARRRRPGDPSRAHRLQLRGWILYRLTPRPRHEMRRAAGLMRSASTLLLAAPAMSRPSPARPPCSARQRPGDGSDPGAFQPTPSDTGVTGRRSIRERSDEEPSFESLRCNKNAAVDVEWEAACQN